MIIITNYFDIARLARGNVDSDSLDILVCGNTFTDLPNPYPTTQVNDYLKKSGHNSTLAEENNKEDPEKTIFCIKRGVPLGSMIDGWLCGSNKTKIEYDTAEELCELLHEELRERKLVLRVRKRLGVKLNE
ncbi:MAG: hypothetical protein HYT73_02605 [Candidatus Aenigmarchaeota archaeon]|nr:hypothetical protein [Candidatus Aenigmarchaeota archaeon]